MNSWIAIRRLLAGCALGAAWSAPGAAQPAGPRPTPIEIFFPPSPPVLGQASAPAAAAEAWPAPAALAPYVSDPFYAPLSSREVHQDIGDALAFRLENYRAAKQAQLAELRAQLYTLRDTDEPARERTLATLARDQASRLTALEIEADRLREELGRSGSGWKEYVRWRIGLFSIPPSGPAAQPKLRRQLLEAAAYYQRGLSPDQRRLLLEQVRALAAAEPPAPPAPGTAGILDFSPALAQIEIPPGLPAALGQQIAAYRAQKRALESEVEAALFSAHDSPEAPALIAALAALGQAQSARFAALEELAETIRRGLAVLKDPLQSPALPPVPPELAARIAAYRTETLALQQALLARVEAVKRAAAASGQPSGDAIQPAITEFTREKADRYAALDQDRDAIRRDVANLPGKPAATSGSLPAALLTKFSQSIRELERNWDYHDYQIAVLQPGLSPEQRRLLFGGALERLALPLPGASLWFGVL